MCEGSRGGIANSAIHGLREEIHTMTGMLHEFFGGSRAFLNSDAQVDFDPIDTDTPKANAIGFMLNRGVEADYLSIEIVLEFVLGETIAVALRLLSIMCDNILPTNEADQSRIQCFSSTLIVLRTYTSSNNYPIKKQDGERLTPRDVLDMWVEIHELSVKYSKVKDVSPKYEMKIEAVNVQIGDQSVQINSFELARELVTLSEAMKANAFPQIDIDVISDAAKETANGNSNKAVAALSYVGKEVVDLAKKASLPKITEIISNLS